MGIADLTTHLTGAPATGIGVLVAAWCAWRLWRRLFRVVIAGVVVGVVMYLAFPGALEHLGREGVPATSESGYH